MVINLTNIDYVYDKDPPKHKDAKPIEKIQWSQFRELFGEEWDPGLNSPFDPVASKETKKRGMLVNIINGTKLENLEKLLEGRKFIGSIIE